MMPDMTIVMKIETLLRDVIPDETDSSQKTDFNHKLTGSVYIHFGYG